MNNYICQYNLRCSTYNKFLLKLFFEDLVSTFDLPAGLFYPKFDKTSNLFFIDQQLALEEGQEYVLSDDLNILLDKHSSISLSGKFQDNHGSGFLTYDLIKDYKLTTLTNISQ